MAGLLAVAAPALITSCKEQPEDGPEAIKEQISDYQEEINDLTLKINALDRQLENMGERPRSRSQIPVTFFELAPEAFDKYFKATASVEAVQSATISPETNGQINQILVEKGQRVSAGQVVARLNTQVIQNSMDEVRTNLALAKTVFERQNGLWEQKIGSEIQYLEAKNAVRSLETRLNTLESQLQMAVMKAPFSGIIDDIFLKEGELAMPGSRVMNLINLNKLYINADVSETYLGSIQKGEPIILRFPAFPEQEIRVPVHRVGHVINPENRTFRVQALIDNRDERYKPNMMATLSIVTFTAEEALVVPSILIKQDVQGHFLYVAEAGNGDLMAKKVYIQRGHDGEGETMIISGLEPGARIIERGHNLVSDGSLIRLEEGDNPTAQSETKPE